MAEVARDQLKVVIEGRGCDLQIGVGEDVPAALQIGADLPEDPSGRDIVGEGRCRREDPVLDIFQVALLGSRAIRALEEFPDSHCTGELGVSRDCPEPIQIRLERTWTE